uniref:Uncharacterized protein n=1 Tax=Panagrolaimus sp. PS1159 TaxID=55785 RepID=A0AC35EWA1_9BILA
MDSSNDGTLNCTVMGSSIDPFNITKLQSTINRSPSQTSIDSVNLSSLQSTTYLFNVSPMQSIYSNNLTPSSIQNVMHESPKIPPKSKTCLERELPRRPPLKNANLDPYEVRFPRVRRQEAPPTFTCFEVIWKMFGGQKAEKKA